MKTILAEEKKKALNLSAVLLNEEWYHWYMYVRQEIIYKLDV